jgi:hypothetical protein
MVDIPLYQPGTHVDVRYDPANPLNVANARPMEPSNPPPGLAGPQGGSGG